MTRRLRILAIIAGLAAVPVAAIAATGGVPTIDLSVLAQAREMVASARSQLSELTNIFQEVNQTRNVIGQIGQGNAGAILQAIGMVSNVPEGDLGQIGSMTSCIEQSLRSTSGGCIGGSLAGLAGLDQVIPDFHGLLQDGQNLLDGGYLSGLPGAEGTTLDQRFLGAWTKAKETPGGLRWFATETLYAPPGTISLDGVAAIRTMRKQMLAQSGTTGLGLAAQGKQATTRAAAAIARMAQQTAASQDLRTDIQVNSAITLKAYEQLVMVQSQMAQLLEITSLQAIDTTDVIHDRPALPAKR